ncbi:FAD-dependent oxidoreductase [Ramlibacter sp. AN1015]|uniref:FAD-dependent oxidoreductase n=1 Tax=Ramlibacter sp. AN1015 TaxID=3133428 RepID=UPI0030BB1A6F
MTHSQPRIAIIGAGPSGLYAAEGLRRHGWQDVTVFERQARVGGMALTRYYEPGDGRRIPYDMGSLQPSSSRQLVRLIEELGLHFGVDLGEGHRVGQPIRLRLYNERQRKYVADFVSHPHTGQPWSKQLVFLRDIARLAPWVFRMRKLAKPGFSHGLPPKFLRMSVSEWMDACDFKLIRPLLLAQASGVACGGQHEHAASERSMVQALKDLVFALKPPRVYGKGLYHPVREGYQEVLIRLAKRLNVVTHANITAIRRDSAGVHLTCNGQSHHFDRLIIACPPNSLAPVMDADAHERALYHMARCNRPTWRVAFLARGIPEPAAGYLFTDQAEYADAPPSLSLFACNALVEGSGKDALRLYGGLVGHGSVEGIEVALDNAANRLKNVFGAHDIQWIDKVFWPQFNTHIGIEDVARGAYDQFEQLQGRNATYYTGEYLSGNSHGKTLEYSWELVRRHFAKAPAPSATPAWQHGFGTRAGS